MSTQRIADRVGPPDGPGLGEIIAAAAGDVSAERAEAYLAARLAYRARRLARQIPDSYMAPEDVEQDLRLRVLSALEGFDPARTSWRTFVCMVLDHHCRYLIRRHAAMQRHEATSPLSLESAGERFAESIPDPRFEADPMARVDRILDVRAAVAGLPDRLRAIACLLMEHQPSEVARILGVSPAAITRAMHRIRPYLAAPGRKKPTPAEKNRARPQI